ncbi:MAG TPA: hypothetical protein VK861_07295 [Bacteroidales bacterium]|nr:hypothetical protein [Bacteroidales bacterium]
MKEIILIGIICIVASCSTSKKSMSLLEEDELFVTRKYIGDFVEFIHTGPENFGGPHYIWVKTSLDTLFGNISAYSKKCDFTPGQRLYLRRTYMPQGPFGCWIYQIENDSSLVYRVSEFQFDDKVLVQTWF